MLTPGPTHQARPATPVSQFLSPETDAPDPPVTPMSDMPTASWTFMTNHTHVLLCIRQDAEIRLRDIAQQVGITERAAQSIVSDLVDGGYLRRERVGRRNHYHVIGNHPLRHPLEMHHTVGELLELLAAPSPSRRAG